MRCRRVGPAAVLIAVAVAGAGCGVPTATDVRVDGPVVEMSAAGAGGEPEVPPGPDDATDERQLVDYLLQAAAADPGDAVEQVRPFLHADDRDAWSPDPQVIIVRVEDSVATPAGDQVRFNLVVRQVGVLSDGAVEPRVRDPEAVEFVVGRERPRSSDEVDLEASAERFRVQGMPRMVMLEDRALEQYFDPRPVYFWDTDHSVLVPDLRWLPEAAPPARRPQILVEWLLAGPSPWLGSLTGLPDGVDQVGNVVPDNGGLVVELTPPAGEVAAGDLEAQLWWTLRPELSGNTTLAVLIDGERREVERGARPHNLNAWEPPQGYVVLDGAVQPYGRESTLPPALTGREYTDVQLAALTESGRLAALVLPDPAGGWRLEVVDTDGVTETDLTGATAVSRPVWLREPAGSGLIVADGRLYRFSPEDDAVIEVPVGAPLSGAITAVAAAPDGRRLALVADGSLYVASIRRDGGLVSVNTPRALPTAAETVTGVAFSRPDRLALAGREDGRFWLYELTVDGAVEDRLPYDLGAPPAIENVVAHPGDPGRESRRGEIRYEADGRGYAYAQRPVPILAEEFGPEPPDDPDAGDPRAPFFLD